MPDIFIYEHDTAVAESIKRICFSYLMSHNYESEIKYIENQSDIAEEQGIYFISCDDSAQEIASHIRKSNTANYIIISADTPKKLFGMIKPSVSPSGYIIKPFRQNDIVRMLDEIYEDFNANSCGKEIFRFKIKAKEISIPYQNIILFESRNKRLAVRTENQEFEFYDTLDSVLNSSPEYFMRIHKSFVVNLSRITLADYGSMAVTFDDGTVAFISRTYKSELKEKLNERRWK